MSSLIQLTYLFAAAVFIFGLKLLSSPKTARRGNLLAAVAMGLYLRSRHPELGAKLREGMADGGGPPVRAPRPGPRPNNDT